MIEKIVEIERKKNKLGVFKVNLSNLINETPKEVISNMFWNYNNECNTYKPFLNIEDISFTNHGEGFEIGSLLLRELIEKKISRHLLTWSDKKLLKSVNENNRFEYTVMDVREFLSNNCIDDDLNQYMSEKYYCLYISETMFEQFIIEVLKYHKIVDKNLNLDSSLNIGVTERDYSINCILT